MSTARVLACGALVVIASALSASAAGADESDVRVSPHVASPGSTVTVSTEECGPDVAYAKGQAEEGGQINLTEGHRDGELSGDFTVPNSTEDGTYSITVKCPPGIRLETSFEVADHPNGPVRGGFGGADGLNGTEIVVGSALVLCATAGGVIMMRRRTNGGTA
ncbi:hypothetical protein ACFU5O_24875 [Streptomyces sp. NPDC057445]|uniref:hypothetical protein n=1 Tax=Streptomyces sp. NPDC057445 TaxID=3346136 RepID=UPI0036987197